MADIGFGIIGCGAIAPMHALSIAEVEGARLVAVSDVREEAGREFGDRYGVPSYTDYRRMLERDDLDAVSICVPTGMRTEIVETCAAAGKHILAEKPLEVSTQRIDRMIAASREAGVKLGCIFQLRFSDAAMEVQRAIADERFGRLVLGDAYIKWYRSQEYYDQGEWRGTWEFDGGGCLMNQGVHRIDLLLSFLGPVSTVHAHTGLVAHERVEVEDVATALLTFENGATGVIEGSTAIWPGHPARVEIHGTRGSAIMEDDALSFWQFRDEHPQDESIRNRFGTGARSSGAGDPTAHIHHEGHRRQVLDFVEAIRDDRAPAVDGSDGRLAVELIEAIYRSARSGQTVTLQG